MPHQHHVSATLANSLETVLKQVFVATCAIGAKLNGFCVIKKKFSGHNVIKYKILWPWMNEPDM